MAVAVAVAAVELSVPSAANAQSSPMYTQLDGSLKDIAACRDSRNSHEVVWGTNLDMEIYRREISSGGAGDTGWVRVPDPGRAKRVATSSDCGYVAFVGSDNCVWLSSNWPTEQPSYTRVGDFCDAIDVAVNDFGAVWAVASNNGIKRYSGSWVTVAGAAKAIDFDDGGIYPWVIGTTDAVYQALNDNGGWLHSGRPGGQFANLDIGVGGGRVVVTTSSPSATFSASECTLDSAGKCIGLWTSDQHGLDMSSVAVTDATTYWMVGRAGASRQGQIWKAQTPASWASQFDGRATDIAACRDNRTNVEVVWAVNASDNDGSNIYRRQFNPGTSSDSGWVPISGAAKKIAASSDCRAVAVIGSDNCVYQAGDYPATSFGWTKIPPEGACDNVDVAADTHGSLYAITEANAVKVRSWSSAGWFTYSGAWGKAIAVDDWDRPWVIGQNDYVYALSHDGVWTKQGRSSANGASLDIGVNGGRVVVTTADLDMNPVSCTLDSSGNCTGKWASDHHGRATGPVAVSDELYNWLVGTPPGGQSGDGEIWRATSFPTGYDVKGAMASTMDNFWNFVNDHPESQQRKRLIWNNCENHAPWAWTNIGEHVQNGMVYARDSAYQYMVYTASDNGGGDIIFLRAPTAEGDGVRHNGSFNESPSSGTLVLNQVSDGSIQLNGYENVTNVAQPGANLTICANHPCDMDVIAWQGKRLLAVGLEHAFGGAGLDQGCGSGQYTKGSLLFFDVTTPASPQYIGRIETPTPPGQTHASGLGWSCSTVLAVDQYGALVAAVGSASLQMNYYRSFSPFDIDSYVLFSQNAPPEHTYWEDTTALQTLRDGVLSSKLVSANNDLNFQVRARDVGFSWDAVTYGSTYDTANFNQGLAWSVISFELLPDGRPFAMVSDQSHFGNDDACMVDTYAEHPW